MDNKTFACGLQLQDWVSLRDGGSTEMPDIQLPEDVLENV
jgi:hypothetical protein